jgi:hypothetical protein
MRHTLLGLALLANATPALAQSAAPAPPAPAAPAIRRWLDVQSVHVGTRFRWYENSADRVVSSSLQWQSMLRGRFLFDAAGRYSVGALAATGAVFPSSWNNTGAGLGRFARPFNVKQLFLAAEPVKGLQFEVGGLFMNRGELAEHLTYDSDAYIVGERVTVRPSRGPVKQLAFTAGYFGDYREVNVFKRLDRLDEHNYRQALVGFSLHPRVAASVDYTYEDGRDIVREAVNIRMPASVKALTLLKFESYQRPSDTEDDGHGFNASADFRIQKLAITAGVMSVDRHYGPFNGDRYETGKRYYSISTYAVTPELSVQFFHSQAFDIDFPIPQKNRFDIVVTFNPTAALKRKGIF